MKQLPGTRINVEEISVNAAERVLDNLFLCGGLTLSQVATLCGVELYTVQNWVSRGFVSPPKGRRYSRRQFCRLVIIKMLKDSLSIPDITAMLSYINGNLADEGDDTVADDRLYADFVGMTCVTDPDNALQAAQETAGENKKLATVLYAMYLAYRSSELKQKAADIIGAEIKTNI